MREIRNTGSTPVLTPEDIADHEAAVAENDAAAAADAVETNAVETDAAEPTAPEVDSPASADEPERDEDVTEAEPAAATDVVDDASADATASESRGDESSVDETPEAEDAPVSIAAVLDASAEPKPVAAPAPVTDLGVAPLTRRQAREHERIRTASVPIVTPDSELSRPAENPSAAPIEEPPVADSVDETPAILKSRPHDVIAEIPGAARSATTTTEATPAATVNPRFGSGLLAGETPVVDLPPSFDQLITRTGSTGVSSSTPNALILSQTPSAAPLVAPVTATGEVLITGSFDLPEGLGSVGHAPGIHDGKDVDAVLVDGELPAASSPTPIAASAAISQVRNNDEIIRPPAPEKGNRLVVILGITAGVLGLGVIAIFTLALTTGVL
jgi:hypothetical protein